MELPETSDEEGVIEDEGKGQSAPRWSWYSRLVGSVPRVVQAQRPLTLTLPKL